MLQVSAVVLPSDLQVYDDVVGALPNLTYRSASPEPPEVTNFRPVAPAGTSSVYSLSLPLAPEMPVTATPLVSTTGVPPPPPPPVQLTPTAVNAAVTSALTKPRSVAAVSTPQAPLLNVLDGVQYRLLARANDF